MSDAAGPPVFVGGVGGSGTRVVAQALQGMGVHMGHFLNHAQDNIWFHRMFVRAGWPVLERHGKLDGIQEALHLFERVSTDPGGLSVGERARLLAAASRNPHRLRHRGFLARTSLRALRAARGEEPVTSWGWKEPNTHMFLPALARRWPEGRYIHLVRHGLDMAYSKNTAQVRRWGSHFGLTEAEAVEASPRASLKMWVSGNQQAIGWAQQYMEGRHLVLRFEDLCHHPAEAITQMAALLDIDLEEDVRGELATIPRPPASIGRYKELGVEGFAEEDLAAVRALGYDVEDIRPTPGLGLTSP